MGRAIISILADFFFVTRVVLIAGLISIGGRGVLRRRKGLNEDMW